MSPCDRLGHAYALGVPECLTCGKGKESWVTVGREGLPCWVPAITPPWEIVVTEGILQFDMPRNWCGVPK